MSPIALHSPRWRARVAPHWGGSLLSLEHQVADTWQPVLRPYDGATRPASPNALACYPLVPWSNRIGGGAFSVEGQTHTVARNVAEEACPIHGHGWQSTWQVQAHSAEAVTLVHAHAAPGPFVYEASLTYALDAAGLHCTLSVRNRGRRLPFGLGLHPFFPRTADVTLHAPTEGLWLAGPDRLPTHLVQPTPESWAFDGPRPLPDTLIDHAYRGWSGHAQLHWPERGLHVQLSADVGHLVIYMPPDADFFCVEPVDHPINALNLPRPMQGGLTVLQQGECIQRTFHITAS